MVGFIFRAVVAALGLWLATAWVGGIRIDHAGTLVLAGFLLGVVNAVVRPVLLVLTLPITLLTLGFFLLVINAAMLGLVALLLPGFHLAGFWSAVAAGLIVSVTGWFGSMLIGRRGRFEIFVHRGR